MTMIIRLMTITAIAIVDDHGNGGTMRTMMTIAIDDLDDDDDDDGGGGGGGWW